MEQPQNEFSQGFGQRGQSAQSEWRAMDSAPRDGTIIETMCTYGVAPWYGLHRFADGRWQSARNPHMSVTESRELWWRPCAGSPAQYTDPTNGAQETPEYWRRACGL